MTDTTASRSLGVVDGLRRPPTRTLTWMIISAAVGAVLLLVCVAWHVLFWAGEADQPPPGFMALATTVILVCAVTAAGLGAYYLSAHDQTDDHRVILTHMAQLATTYEQLNVRQANMQYAVDDLAEVIKGSGTEHAEVDQQIRRLLTRVESWDDGYRTGATDAIHAQTTNGRVVAMPLQHRGDN